MRPKQGPKQDPNKTQTRLKGSPLKGRDYNIKGRNNKGGVRGEPTVPLKGRDHKGNHWFPLKIDFPQQTIPY